MSVVEEKGNSKEVDIEETCQEIVVDRRKSKGYVTEAGFGVMEVDKEKDDDKDDDGGPVVGGSGGRSALNGHHRSGMRGHRGQ
ncbi:hypothetical protein HID58_048524 [Brassica napus]|uniref:Uncharacterized protein n=1 Tax=Brassica napus TaxID=3708 RepID=A0ABQ8B3X6_BRANA|nr:hypothetical protein HID58_048524 [Brassica napus]